MRGFIALDFAGKVRFDHGPGMGAILCIGKLHTDSGLAVACSALGGDPDYLSGNGQAFLEFHYSEQKEYFVAQTESFGAGHEQASPRYEGHI